MPINILMVDDRHENLLALEAILKDMGHHLVFAHSGAEALKLVLKNEFAVIILDIEMPTMNGFDTASLIRKREKSKSTPIIFLTASNATETSIFQGYLVGAVDYLVKPIEPEILRAKVSVFVDLFVKTEQVRQQAALLHRMTQEAHREDISKLKKKSEEAMWQMAHYDVLTGLPNRNMIANRLRDAIEINRSTGSLLAFFLIDLNRFKEINDTLGHPHGDLILKEIGARLQEILPEPNMAARLGGDEFAILLPKLADIKDIDRVIQKIIKTLTTPFLIDGFDGLPIMVEASIGVALYPEHGTNPNALMQRADVAMYAAKQSGRGYAIYVPDLDKHSPEKLMLLTELRRAMDQNELTLYYQPKIAMVTKKVIGLEGLIRWKHPSRGMIPPDAFILSAEQTGLIGPLTLFVIEAAARQCKAWQKEGVAIPIAVNLSARNLMDARLPEQVSEILARYDLSPSSLQFEITESAIMADPHRAAELLARLHKMGHQFSIDDFGTGYSSLGYLKRLPVDEIKIDQSFVTDMVLDEHDETIVRSIIDLSHNLVVRVVAEGVENKETWDHLSALGCDVAQGYYISRPIPANELTRWLSESPWVV